MIPLLPACNVFCERFCTKPLSFMMRATRSRVSGATSGRLCNTRETVGSETPALAAISAMVIALGVCRFACRFITGNLSEEIYLVFPKKMPMSRGNSSNRLRVTQKSGVKAFGNVAVIVLVLSNISGYISDKENRETPCR